MKSRNKTSINQYLVIGISTILFVIGIPNIYGGLDILQFINDGRVEPEIIWHSVLVTAGFGVILAGTGVALLFKSRSVGTRIHPKNRNQILAVIAVFLVFLPWLQNIDFGFNEVSVDGVSASAAIVMSLALAFSLISWSLLAWASRDITVTGLLLGIILGASLALPFIHVLGPMAGIIVGLVGGFAAFMFQQTKHATNGRPIIIAFLIPVMSYATLIFLILSVQDHTMGDGGIGSWTGTPEGMEEPVFGNAFGVHIEVVVFVVICLSLIITARIIQEK